jgi:hypothetical protein
MVKCPFCGFENEDGVLFCEQCKSDLSAVPSSPAPAPVEAVPMAAIVDEPAPPTVTAAQLAEWLPPDASPPPFAFAAPDDVLPNLGMGETLPLAEVVPTGSAPEASLPVAEAVAAPPAPAAAPVAMATGAQPRLKVMRGLKVGVEFPIYSEYNYIGRADEKPVDIDLEDQEPPDRVWCSRQHAVIHFDEAAGVLTLEDLNSSNGTYVNRNRVYPGEKKTLNPNDVVQIGTVHMKLLV